MGNRKRSKRWMFFFALLALSFFFLLFFSVSTSFIYDYPHSVDSHVFQVIGKLWNDGYLPYVDLWDHKGPLIYFINKIGYAFTGNRYGVFIIQMLFFFSTLVLLWNVFIKRMSFRRSLSCIFLSLSFLAFCYGDNCVEEYIMPFLVLSFYLQYVWVSDFSEKGKMSHPSFWFALYGFVLAFSLLTRLTNALGVCAGAGFIEAILLFKRKWRLFFENALFFAIGFLFLFLPFALYFHFHGAFQEMWYGTFLFNLDYVSNSENVITQQQRLYSLISLVSCYFLLTVSIIRLLNKFYCLGGYMLLVCVSLLSWLLNSNGYLSYSMLSLPFLVIAFLDLETLKKKYCTSAVIIESVYLFFSISTILISSFFISREIYRGYHYICERQTIDSCAKLVAKIPEKERTSFVAYGIRPSIYLYYDVKPSVRFFCNHNFYCYNSPIMATMMDDALKKQTVKWIIAKKPYSGVWKDDLKEQYYEIMEEQLDNNSRAVLLKLKQ